MRMLIVGGTQFVGRHIVEAALAAGHEVTLLHRGKTGRQLYPQARHIIADRDGDLGEVAEGSWDATIDVSAYRPEQVTRLAEVLETGFYTFISTVSVYDDPPAGYTEDARLRDDDSYGGLKAACERVAQERFGRPLILRLPYVVGPYDHLVRFTWWVKRIAEGGEVLAPGRPEEPIQLIDARDLAAWALEMTARSRPGIFHPSGPAERLSFGDLLTAMQDGTDATLTWVDPEFLLARGVGHEDLPLWPAADEEAAVNRADPARAIAAGLTFRPLAQTIRDARLEPAQPGRLSRAREAELLRQWRQR
ncbi:sugar nucleotide-binding protein [Dactylosporangium vinaceum]|uniref:NAD-dependent epimerase/dehydratase family protein n=1 Tax=Dactylosporangium vinaceum TaxID=53362 RepID=A0ABV5MBA9_9ACTN|nr:NAD-dependent epimerase/dehydratase family protein [Dactylosporangium vinaceum]UAB98385.1 sugar nucleotide-binding protein [Dactylosporangium vinaceum]